MAAAVIVLAGVTSLAASPPAARASAPQPLGGASDPAAVYAATPPTARPTPSASVTAAIRAAASGVGPRWAWKVGVARESVDPTPDEIKTGQLHLGGFGILPTRATSGPLVDPGNVAEHIYARAMAVTNAKGQTLILAAIENQGTFAAYKQGGFGLSDIRAQVSHDTGVPVANIVIDTDHSHAGPDLIGLWGGVPVDYLQRVHNQAVRALDEAYKGRRPARLLVGTNTPTMPTPAQGHYLPGTATPGEYFDHSQFGPDLGPVAAAQQQGVPVPSQVPQVGGTGYRDDLVDTQLRVLQAVDLDGDPIGTLINYAAHATVMGGDNTLYSADWPGRVAQATEQALHEPVAVTMVADVGRTQPPRPNSDPQCGQAGHISCDLDKLDTWTRLFTPYVVDAVAHATPVKGNQVESEEVFTREVATNPALFGVTYTGEVPVRGYGAYRSATPPWFTGNLLGTFASAHRLGDILLTANPGEAYPDIRFGMLNSIASPQVAFTFGLANDQLGYLVAPASEYGWITYSQPGNDNAFFNVSAQYGDHLMCTLTSAAAAIGFPANGNASPYGPNAVSPNCGALTASDAVPEGPAPQQPWPFGDGVALPSPFPQ